MRRYIAELNDDQHEKVKELFEELGIKLVPYNMGDPIENGEYYDLYEDDRL